MSGYAEFQCGNCNNRAQGVPGTTVACPSCGTHVQVPGAPGPAPQPLWGAGGGHVPGQAGSAVQSGHWYQCPQGQAQAEQKQWQDQQREKWTTPLLLAGCHQPLWCCCGYFCLPCTVWVQRRKLLMADKDPSNWQYYHCCAGIFGEGCTSKCDQCTKGNEQCCAALEACCCSGCAMHGNRYMIMLHYGLENTCCDIFLFWLSCICSVLACLTGYDELELIADILYYLLMGCMAAQHENEMDKKGYPRNQNIIQQGIAQAQGAMRAVQGKLGR
eukprot:TRINITY_DN1422_c0_g2_i1.p1 TRINITY_DN1422_c0_g2~~TRINITY_DN1422_c0_g2_i1.p1  ORF type:complete len:272 (+),score=75.98 TRINITY_DN1422_c0_g2_i1:85-900(+)